MSSLKILKNKEKATKISVLNVALYILLAAFIALIIATKANISLDEIYSYGLANYTKGLNLTVQENVKYEPASSAYMEYVVATDRFNYKNVWQNQANDVHPPLYYSIVHTISSLLPGTFSFWYAGAINIFFSLLTLFFVQKLAYILGGKNKKIMVAVSAVFVLCAGVIYANGFLRMYIMAMCQVTALTYLIVRQTGEDKTKFFTPLLIALVASGALIHYYCIIYTAALCGMYFIYLLCNKNFRNAGLLVGAGAISAAVACAVFPAMILHIFFSYRGQESFDNLESGNQILERLSVFGDILNRNLFGGLFVYIVAVIIVLAVITAAKKKGGKTDACTLWQYILVLVPTAVFFVLVSAVAVYKSNRYITPIYAVLICAVFSLMFRLMEGLLDKKKFMALALAVVAAVSLCTLKTCQKTYTYTDTKPLLNFAAEHSESECLYLFDGTKFRMMPSMTEVSKYKNVTFVNYTNPGFLWSCDYSANEDLVVIIVNDDQQALNEVLAEYKQFTQYDIIGDFGYATTYYLHG